MLNRREFIGTAAGTMASLSMDTREGRAVPASDQVNLGIIGPGSRGQSLMRTFLRVPGVRFAALCDVYEPRFEQARKVTGQSTPAFKDYRQLLDQKDVDAVVVATPLSFHEDHVIGSLASGRHVYGEKDMAKTVEACNNVYKAVKRTGKHYQIGTQYHYAPWFEKGLEHIRTGKIGDVTQIYAYWHRNNNWRRPVPDPNNRELERLINWRLYREFSGGLLAELGTHQIQFAIELFGSIPESVLATGGIDYWKDGREVPDNVQAVFRFAGGKTMFFSSVMTNRYLGMQIQVLGTGGTVVLTESGGIFYYERGSTNSAVPQEVVLEHGVLTSASLRAELPYSGPGTPINVPDSTEGNADFQACRSFIQCIRENKRPNADESLAWDSGVTTALGNMAIDTGQRILFAEHAKKPT
jgi:predicted dehydrogenase